MLAWGEAYQKHRVQWPIYMRIGRMIDSACWPILRQGQIFAVADRVDGYMAVEYVALFRPIRVIVPARLKRLRQNI